MKKSILLLAIATMITGASFAQTKKNVKAVATEKVSQKVAGAQNKVTQVKEAGDALKFENIVHNFGTVPEGPAASYDFVFTNTTDKPIQLESVRASCGCTTPFWSKEPIEAGATSKITVSYNTKGRPGNIYKTITVKSTAGQKVLTIKGNVEKAPTSSVPTNNNSMIKH